MPGMTANVSIITDRQENVLTVPNSALKFTVADNHQKYEEKGIWLEKKGKPERVTVKTGLSDDSYTQIISDEVHAGDIVYVGKKVNGKNNKRPAMPPRM